MSEDRKLERLIEEAEAAEAAAAPRPLPRARQARPVALGTVFSVSLAALVAMWWWQQQLSGPDEAALEAGRRLGLKIAAEMIHDFAHRNGRYPDALSEAVPIKLDIRYRKAGEGFELQAMAPSGRTIVVRDK